MTALPEDQYNFVMAACSTGSTVEAHYYPEATHWLPFVAATRDDVLRRAIEFFRKHLDL